MIGANGEPEVPGCARSFARALWGLELSVRALPPPNQVAPRRPSFVGSRVWLPASPLAGVAGGFSDYLLAATAHACAHIELGGPRFPVKSLRPVQIAIVSLIEDARVERLARQRYPGLAALWAPYHRARPGGVKTTAALFARLARALSDDAYVDDDAWVRTGRELFFAARSEWHDAGLSRRIGNVLGNDLGQMRVQFNAKDYVVEPAYRDDHVGLWQLEQESTPDGTELESEGARRVQNEALQNQARREQGEPEARNQPERSERDLAPGLRIETKPSVEPTIFYAEWDYVIARERPRFCSVHERVQEPGNLPHMDAALAGYALVRRRLERSARRLATQRPVHVRRLTAGDRLDLPAAVAAVVARSSGTRPDPRVYRTVRLMREPPALLVLVDLSESLNDKPPSAATTLLELARNASGLLASTLAGITEHLAIHGFSSNGRHDVGYYRFKDFDQPYDDRVRMRLAGMRASSSTRLGAALRHAGRTLGACAADRKLLLVVTDGEPSDVDVHDPEYLLVDAKQATLRNRQQGLSSFCVGLNAAAENSIRRIFGPGNYLLLDRLESLPEQLSRLYLRLSA